MPANQQAFFQAITARLRSETTLQKKWIAARVQTGTAKGANSVLPHLAQSPDLHKTASASNPAPSSNSNLRFDPEQELTAAGNSALELGDPQQARRAFQANGT